MAELPETPAAAAPPSLAAEPWLRARPVRRILDAITGGGFAARIVGGAVRNALMGLPVRDVDIATTAVPGEVVRLARAAGLHTVPTGIEHGTVTVIAEHHPVEVTTLRRDVETFGRHAVVAFTTDWAEDAARRDFTINALYCGADGTVHDPLGGYADVVARRVRFIGRAEDRIREDYLRILRFFRFSAEYGRDSLDPDGLFAAVGLRNRLQRLSGERLRAELVKLIVAPRAAYVADIMHANDVLTPIIGHRTDPGLLERLCRIEAATARPPDAALRLAALAVRDMADAEALRLRLKLSNAEAECVAAAVTPLTPPLSPDVPEAAAKALLYRLGRPAFERHAAIDWARSDAPADDARWHALLTLGGTWPVPAMPVTGADVLARGVAAGPAVGQILSAFESAWIEAGFPADRDAALRNLAALVAEWRERS